MTGDDDQGRQRTVAELLEQYGGGRPGIPRRRRRAEDRDERDAAQGGDEYGDDSAGGPAEALPRPERPDTGSHDAAGGYGAAPDASGYGGTEGLFPDTAPAPPEPGREQGWGTGGGYGAAIDPLTGAPIDPLTGRPLPSAGYAPPMHRPDPPTEQLPRYPDPGREGPLTGPITGPMTGPVARAGRADADVVGPPTGRVSPADLFADGDDEDDGISPGAPERGKDAATSGARQGGAGSSAAAAVTDRAASRYARDEPAGLSGGLPDAHDDGRPHGLGGWAVLVLQWVLGAVAGAFLWVGFSYLWRSFPVIALVAAVITTAALVLLVRAIRRSDDLQTTMLAVLVGLVVTISPAVLLLAVR